MSIHPGKRTHYDIMLSSTFKDLEEHRAAVIDAVQRLQLFPQAMETDSALPEDLIEASLHKVRVADAYIGVVGYRYGQIPECADRNPENFSITELEYQEAEKLKLPICMFVMSDKHDVPKSAILSSTPEEQQKLRAFQSRATRKHIYAEFDSVADLKPKALQSIGVLRERLEARSGTITPAKSQPPSLASLPLVAMPPFTPGHEFAGRAKELQLLDDWAVSPQEPVLVLEAIGGMGKSMLCWQWVNHRARQIRPDFAGIFWYSFYERGADMRDFCAYCIAYLTGHPVEEFQERRTASLGRELVPLLRQRPWLLVLDGLERVLAAYNRYDAAQVRDEEVSAAHDSENQKAQVCIRPADSDLLRILSEAGPSKFLMSSRLMPAALLNSTGLKRPGVAHSKLIGLDPSDAEAMLRKLGIRGDSAQIRRYLDKNFGCHPLVVGVVGGLIRNYAPYPGDFDRWVDDQHGGAAIDVATMDLVQRRNHILKAAFDGLAPDTRILLARIGLVSESIDYQTAVELNPRRPEPPQEVDKPRSWRSGNEEQKAAYETYLQEMAVWRDSPSHNIARQWLGSALQDLESRGLLQWDRANAKYDLHPVARGYAVNSLAPEQREGVAQRVIDHFSSRPDPPGEQAVSMHDVGNGLQVVRTLLRLGKFKQAIDGILSLGSTFFWNLEAFEEYLGLVRPLFPNGWRQCPSGVDGPVLCRLWNDVAICLNSLADGVGAIALHERVIEMNIELDWTSAVLADLSNLSATVNGLAAAYRLDELSQRAASVFGDEEAIAMACLWRLVTAIRMGDFVAAERYWADFDKMPRPSTRSIYRPGYGEYWLARLRFFSGTLREPLLADVERMAREGNNRSTYREICALRGEWMLSLRRYAEAANAFEDDINLTREVNLDASWSEAHLALAEVKQGQIGPARETASRLSTSENPPQLALAELYLALEEASAAKPHALGAYRQAWADGPPYVFWWELKRARAVLAELGEPEPQLPPFDPASIRPFPFEPKLLAYLEEKRKEKKP